MLCLHVRSTRKQSIGTPPCLPGGACLALGGLQLCCSYSLCCLSRCAPFTISAFLACVCLSVWLLRCWSPPACLPLPSVCMLCWCRSPPAHPSQALQDFKQRISKYNDIYEPIDDRRLHYIKLIDM